ncbi:hypothetical protein RYX36_032938, partial [Vicia faba]
IQPTSSTRSSFFVVYDWIIAGNRLFGSTFCNITGCAFAFELPWRFLNSYCLLRIVHVLFFIIF